MFSYYKPMNDESDNYIAKNVNTLFLYFFSLRRIGIFSVITVRNLFIMLFALAVKYASMY